MSITSINPHTNEKINTYDTLNDAEATAAINASHEAFLSWRETDLSERSEKMHRVGDILEAKKEELAQLMANEMGKPITGGRAEIDKCALTCHYYADHAEAFLEDELIDTNNKKSFITYQPIGVVLAVMPWNFPFWQVIRFAAPALMAGNAGILKHASNVPACALMLEKLFIDAGFPDHLFKTLLIGSKQVSAVIEHPHVKAVTLTGSSAAGKAVASTAGNALKKSVLELGGSDPYIILEDADIDLAAKACVTSRLLNSGQSCIGAKRFIVLEQVYDQFVAAFTEKMSAAVVGNPLEDATVVGPLARHDLRDELHDQVKQSIKQGANCVLGGEIPDEVGAYYPPTILTDVKPGMVAYHEELFGPVATIIKATNEEEAINIANDTIFGLGAGIFTQDTEKGEHIAKTQLHAGAVYVNDFVKSDPRLPFGGIKESGYGRELSALGMREFLNIKTVVVN